MTNIVKKIEEKSKGIRHECLAEWSQPFGLFPS